ncbi:pimeloyl-ACP methyl ester esterase BioH [Noviluteimonas dokdonensis]|uniref:pimeloyl-ACP methyl ester esterase BioH n=1 Tax=Noviluteimonas dokdonensis TaxID=414050 RepID=UPI00055FE67F|nr:pimeloyl-ACP methyl ester esterase BioH [Lysobacter dokdonensis]
MHVDVVGDGPPLVLLHGWAMHGGVFAPLVARLRDRFTLHIVDLPGHGLSRDCGVPLTLDAGVAAIAAHVPAAPWFGWSLGGLFALHAAIERPEHATHAALICASARFVRSADWRYGVSPEIFRDFATGLRTDYRGTLDRFVALEAFGSDHAKDEVRALREDLFARGEPSAHVLADGLDLLKTADLRTAMPRLRSPSLWLAGRRDRLVDARAMRESAALSGAPASVHVVEHAGHAPFLTHADDVAAHLADFLRA